MIPSTIAVEELTRHLADCPAEFLAEPRSLASSETGTVVVSAVVSDLLCDLGSPDRLTPEEAAWFDQSRKQARAVLQLVLVACWLCHAKALRAASSFAPAVRKWLRTGLVDLANRVTPELFVTDPDRREELVRRLFLALDLQPLGETEAQAADRFKSLDSIERERILRDTRKKLERARQLAEKMASEAAQAAAARYSSE